MGDRDFARRKKFFTPRDRNNERSRDRPNRPERDRERRDRFDREEKYSKAPTILSKPRSEEKKEEPQIQPKILIKPREEGSGPTSSRPKQEAEVQGAAPPVKHQEPPDLSNLWISFPPMKQPVKFIDPFTMQIKDSLLDFLVEQPDFMVVGAFGPQGVGKSTLLSHIAHPQKIGPTTIFKTGSLENLRRAKHCTDGIDVYVSGERLILLDCQASQMSSVMGRPCRRMEGLGESEGGSQETELELAAMQHLTFLFSVCHIVLLIQDWVLDTELLRLVRTAELLKPHIMVSADDGQLDYYPQFMLVHTKANSSFFNRHNFREVQEVYRRLLEGSQLVLESGVGLGNGRVLPTLSPELCDSDPINLFFLPSFKTSKKACKRKSVLEFRGHPGYSELLKKLRSQLCSLDRLHPSRSIMSEKAWFNYAVRVWDNIRKCPFIQEYSRLLHAPIGKEPTSENIVN